MTPTEQEQLIAKYWDNETQLYQDWYAGFLSQSNTESDSVPFAQFPSLDRIKGHFKKWVEENLGLLKKIVCQETSIGKSLCKYWKSLSVSGASRHELEHLVIAFALSLDAQFGRHEHLLIVGTVLVMGNYLDNLCEDCRQLVPELVGEQAS